MATDMFLKIDGIEGESVDDKHPNEIELLSLRWGMNQGATMHVGTGGGGAGSSLRSVLHEHWSTKPPTSRRTA